MEGNADLKAMQDIIDSMMKDGASQEDIDAALMEYAYRHEHAEACADDGDESASAETAEACFDKATACFEAYRDAEAAQLLRRAIELDPEHFDARRLLLQLESSDESLMGRLLELDAEATARYCRSRGIEGIGQSDGKAWEDPVGRMLVRIKADEAFLSYDLGRYRPARKACEEALVLDAQDCQNLRGLLIMLHAYFEEDEAARSLFERFSREESCWFLLGMSLASYKTGDLAGTRSFCDRLLQAYPDFLVELSLFMASSQNAMPRQLGEREQRRDEVFAALEDAAAVIDSTPGFLAWVAEEYARELFGL